MLRSVPLFQLLFRQALSIEIGKDVYNDFSVGERAMGRRKNLL